MKVKRKCAGCGNYVDCEEDTLNGAILLEQHYECPNCGFERHWAYGHLMPDDSEYETQSHPTQPT